MSKINNIKIKPIPGNGNEFKRPIRAKEWFAHPYSNIVDIAGKNTGKTTFNFNAVEACVCPGTNVMIFSPTINADPSFKAMEAMLKRKKCNVLMKEHFIEDGINYIQEFMEDFVHPDDRKDKDSIVGPKKDLPCSDLYCFDKPPDPEEKEKKPFIDRMTTPETIILLDDFSSDLKNPFVTKFLTKNRHFLTKVFTSLHDVTNLTPSAWANVDVCCVFKNQNPERIQRIATSLALIFKEDERNKSKLHEYYEECIQGPHDFMYIQTRPLNIRRNMNIKLL